MKLSIITINLNNKDGLQKTIQSVIEQSFKNFEFIVIDGGSTDGSVDLIKEYSTKINYWISEKDNGIYNAMNKGVKIAKGEYCNFMNSGDIFYDTNTLDAVFTKRFKSDIIIGKAKTNHRIIPPPNHPTLLYFYSKKPINHQAAFVKRNLLVKYPYEENKYKIVSDYKFFFDAFIRENCSYSSINELIVNFDDKGIGSMNLETNLKEQTSIVKSFIFPRILEDYTRFNHMDSKVIRMTLPIARFFDQYGRYFDPLKYFNKLKKCLFKQTK